MISAKPFRPAFLVAAVLAAAPGCDRGHPPAETDAGSIEPLQVELARVQRSELTSSLELVGTLIPVRATTIVPEVDGIIESFPASSREVQYEEDGETKSVTLGLDIGHRVKRGDILVQLDPTDFELARDMAAANLALAQRNLEKLLAWTRDEEVAQARAQLEEAEAALGRAKADLDRATQLRDENAVSQRDHDAFVMSFKTAEAARKRAEAALELALAGPTAEELAVARAQVAAAEAEVAVREERLAKTTIRAPYDAVITERYIDVGDRITALPRVEVMQIVDPSVLFAEVCVAERYQSLIKLDDPARVVAAGVDTPAVGRVDLINEKIDPSTRTFRIRVSVDNRRRLFKAGGFVRVELPLNSAADALVVPARAVAVDEGRHTVFVYRDGRVDRRPISIGISNEEACEVLSGVSEGEAVVVGNTALLADGATVRPKSPDVASSTTTSGDSRRFPSESQPGDTPVRPAGASGAAGGHAARGAERGVRRVTASEAGEPGPLARRSEVTK